MFKSLSIKEEKQLLNTINICLIEPHSRLLDIQSNDRHNVYFYPKECFNDGIIVFTCFHIITNKSFILHSIEVYKDSDNLYDLDEEVIYSLIPLLIKFSIELAVLDGKDEVILKSGIPHFADHLVDNKFRIYKRIERSSSERFSIIIKGVKNTKLEDIIHETSTH